MLMRQTAVISISLYLLSGCHEEVNISSTPILQTRNSAPVLNAESSPPEQQKNAEAASVKQPTQKTKKSDARLSIPTIINTAPAPQNQLKNLIAGTPFETALNNASTAQSSTQQENTNLILGSPLEVVLRPANARPQQQ